MAVIWWFQLTRFPRWVACRWIGAVTVRREAACRRCASPTGRPGEATWMLQEHRVRILMVTYFLLFRENPEHEDMLNSLVWTGRDESSRQRLFGRLKQSRGQTRCLRWKWFYIILSRNGLWSDTDQAEFFFAGYCCKPNMRLKTGLTLTFRYYKQQASLVTTGAGHHK